VDLFSLAERKLSEIEFVAFDTEATGYSNFSDRVIEVAGVRFRREAEAWAGGERFAELANPERPIPAETIAIHGIVDSMVGSAARVVEVLDRFFAFVGERVLVVHYAPSDVGFMAFAYARAGRDVPRALVVDTFFLARKLCPGVANYSLETLAKTLSLPAPAHRALPDAIATRALFEACVSKLGAPEEVPFGSVLAQTGAPLTLEEFSHIPLLLPDMMAPVERALAEHLDLTLHYRGGSKSGMARRVTPSHYFARQGHVFLEAYCHTDQEMKSFRIDRIENVSVVEPAPA
jgi:DNA polymerase III epsilon subunit family exonuclease